jgi:hypothetical protein
MLSLDPECKKIVRVQEIIVTGRITCACPKSDHPPGPELTGPSTSGSGVEQRCKEWKCSK